MARPKRTLSIVPQDRPLSGARIETPKDELREKLDALALDLAEKLRKDNDIPIPERLAGLKVLTEFWKSDKRQSGQTAKPQSAFDGYRRQIAGEDE